MAHDSRIVDENREENELMLELSIGGIFGKSNTTQNVNENDFNVEESKRDNQAQKRRELRRKREEKLKKTVCFGSCGSVSGPFVENEEWLETQMVGQNDDVLEIEHVRKKERIVENGIVNGKKCVFRPTVCRSFRPYNDNINVRGGEDEMDGGGRRNCKVSSNGSGGGGGGSSAYSDVQCSSHQGGATDDSRSISSNSQLDQQLPSTSTATDPFDPSDQPTGSSKQTVSTNKLTDSTISKPSPVKTSDRLNSHASIASNPPSKPDASSQHQQASVLARMPCVSTTGNGPNGKTVSGFLYRYTKNEVSIVCVCHGDSFSPAGFVEHAGGVNIAHPLKHITIFPTAFAS